MNVMKDAGSASTANNNVVRFQTCGDGCNTDKTGSVLRRRHRFPCFIGGRSSLAHGLRVTLTLCLTIFCGTATAGASPSYAVWYGPKPPIDQLAGFDRIIIEADNFSDEEITALKQHGGKVLAYLSIGEWNPQRVSKKPVEKAWILGKNDHWRSQIMDLTAVGWQSFLYDRATELKQRGVNGLFLDTLDSHMLPPMSPGKREEQQRGLVKIISAIKTEYPDFILAANRGFEVMDRIAPHLAAVAAESLYQGWNSAQQQYRPVPPADRRWLTQMLKKIQAGHHLDILILDYLPPQQREKARKTARKIIADGFIPWIATPAFDHLGIGALEAAKEMEEHHE